MRIIPPQLPMIKCQGVFSAMKTNQTQENEGKRESKVREDEDSQEIEK